jgi:hypothetical protein
MRQIDHEQHSTPTAEVWPIQKHPVGAIGTGGDDFATYRIDVADC